MSRRRPTGANHPILVAYLNALPPAGAVWPPELRQRWISGVQAAFNIIYTTEKPAPPANNFGGFTGGEVGMTGDVADEPEQLTD